MSFDLHLGRRGPVNDADHRAVGLATLDACRDAANEWVFPEAGPAWPGIKAAYVATMTAPTHFVDVTASIDAGVASLREHRAYIEGLGREFDPDEFLRNMAGYTGLVPGASTPWRFTGTRWADPARFSAAGRPVRITTRPPPCMRWRGPRRPVGRGLRVT